MKIDVFYNGKYLHSTNTHKRCKDAKNSFLVHINRLILNNNIGLSQNTISQYKEMAQNTDKIKAFFDRN